MRWRPGEYLIFDVLELPVYSNVQNYRYAFIVTDPVSGATSKQGRLVFGIGVGILVYCIRAWGGYPDAVAFAVLLMNLAAPTIDYYTTPRTYGHRKAERGMGKVD